MNNFFERDMQNSNNVPLISFGIIADVQYANIDDIFRYGRMRYHRNSLNQLRNAVNDWKVRKNEHEIKFVLQLGDLVEGFANCHLDIAPHDLKECLNVLESLYPNHDFKSEREFKNNSKLPKIFHVWGKFNFLLLIYRLLSIK